MCNTTSPVVFVAPDPLALIVPVTTEAAFTANAASVSDAEQEESLQVIGALIQDLFSSKTGKVFFALDALYTDLSENDMKCDNIVTAGGCFALVLLLKDLLKKVADMGIPACRKCFDNPLGILQESLDLIDDLTYKHDVSRAGITAVGGVEAVIEVMNTFPKLQELQRTACSVLRNLARCNIGKEKAAESDGIKALFAAVNNNLFVCVVCERACWALVNIVKGRKENTKLLISLGGAATVSKVKNNWPGNAEVQTQVRILAALIAAEMNSWASEE
jgi:hypothetical protein